ncbi:YbjQ family protein [Litorilituus sediminis]|uniref:YbjQ family protein n=1 Tax=Litorilituus sediminis TaxID=718192 RepID=A0A4P6P8E3_9GAMM|nr:YbjQ family protein [Litorilituus sediminis]QBG35822.1 YbjQ family protein [Litorilituus sediminis]
MAQFQLEIAITLLLLFLGYIFGRHAEKSHFKSIIAREEQHQGLVAVSVKSPTQDDSTKPGMLVTGSVVISVDYFKRFLAALRTIFGGRVTSYETLLDRARREAILRMKEEAKKLNAERIYNIKLETSSISKSASGNIGAVEVLAYGTAVLRVNQ